MLRCLGDRSEHFIVIIIFSVIFHIYFILNFFKNNNMTQLQTLWDVWVLTSFLFALSSPPPLRTRTFSLQVLSSTASLRLHRPLKEAVTSAAATLTFLAAQGLMTPRNNFHASAATRPRTSWTPSNTTKPFCPGETRTTISLLQTKLVLLEVLK